MNATIEAPQVKDEQGNNVNLREYVERVFDERERALRDSIDANQRAIDLAAANLDRRLGGVETRQSWVIGVGSILVVLAAFVGFAMGWAMNPR